MARAAIELKSHARYYRETDRGHGAYLLVDHASRRCQEGGHFAFFVVAVFDKPDTLEFPRLTQAHSGYLNSCEPLETADVTEDVKATLENAMSQARNPDCKLWNKQYVPA